MREIRQNEIFYYEKNRHRWMEKGEKDTIGKAGEIKD
jgi:hypothetical protein